MNHRQKAVVFIHIVCIFDQIFGNIDNISQQVLTTII